jgi:hypothetical protein
MENNVKVQSLEDCIRNRNLYLVHVGHSWLVLRTTDNDSVIGGAVPLPELIKRLPKAAMINTVMKFENVKTLESYLKAGNISKDTLFDRLNKPLDSSGYEEVLGV